MKRWRYSVGLKAAAAAAIQILSVALLRRLSSLMAALTAGADALEEALAHVPAGDAYEAAHYCKHTVFARMDSLRTVADALEAITAASYWPYPTYTELLFSIK